MDKTSLKILVTFPSPQATVHTQARINCNFAPWSVVCTRYGNGKTCSGDSGGPLVQDKDTDGRWVLYGVLSFGAIPCNQAEKSSFNGYIDVSHNYERLISLVRNNP